MKTFKIYGEAYPLSPTTREPADGYAAKNELRDEQPKGRIVGYVTMEDGSIIECYKKFPIALILIPLILIIIAGIGVAVYFYFGQPKDVEVFNTLIKIGDDNNVVTYSGFPSVREGALKIEFTNGDYPATILVEGEGIETHETSVEPGAYVESIPCQFTTEEGLVEATITIKTETSTQSFPILVELPDNLNGNDYNEGLEGYWFGEQIYGTE